MKKNEVLCEFAQQFKSLLSAISAISESAELLPFFWPILSRLAIPV